MAGRGEAAKGLIHRCGAGRIYLNEWWARHVRERTPWSSWHRANRAVFVHVPKTAGTSVYRALGIPMEGETHCPAVGYKAADPAAWASSFRFAFVRNPWDRAVSAFHYLKTNPLSDDDARWSERNLADCPDFEAFCARLERPGFRHEVLMWRHFTPQWFFLADRYGSLDVSRVARFERYDADMKAISAGLGILARPARENVVPRPPYETFYTPKTAGLIGRLYKRDAALFGYRFEGTATP